MSTSRSWIDETLEKFHLREDANDDSKFDSYQMIIDRSRLPERMSAICSAINAQSGHGLMYHEILAYPYPVIRRYILERDNVDTIMELAILFEGPGVVFSSNKTRPWVKSIQRYCGYSTEHKNNVVYRMVIDPEDVSDAELQQWFTYLLSGLRNSFKPLQRVPFRKDG